MHVDASAMLKLYVEEPESEVCEEVMGAEAREQLRVDWRRCNVIELDETTCRHAAEIAEVTGARSLDALHLGAAQRVGVANLPFLTYDLRQAQVARSLGWTVLGS